MSDRQALVGPLDATARNLAELRHRVIDDLALAAVALALALVAGPMDPSWAAPLFVGGVAAGCLALRADRRRRVLIDHLALRRDAYGIPDVRAYGERCASVENRLMLASIARQVALGASGEFAERFDRLAVQLEDEGLALVPECAVSCEHLLTGGSESPLSANERSGETLVQLHHILAGFEPRAI